MPKNLKVFGEILSYSFFTTILTGSVVPILISILYFKNDDFGNGVKALGLFVDWRNILFTFFIYFNLTFIFISLSFLFGFLMKKFLKKEFFTNNLIHFNVMFYFVLISLFTFLLSQDILSGLTLMFVPYFIVIYGHLLIKKIFNRKKINHS